MNRFPSTAQRPAQTPVLPTIGKLVLIAALPLTLAGCFNSSDAEMTLDLGSVSIGQQLMDLDAAKSAGALSPSEHRMIREKLINGIAALDIDLDEDDEPIDVQLDIEASRSESREEEDGFNWF